MAAGAGLSGCLCMCVYIYRHSLVLFRSVFHPSIVKMITVISGSDNSGVSRQCFVFVLVGDNNPEIIQPSCLFLIPSRTASFSPHLLVFKLYFQLDNGEMEHRQNVGFAAATLSCKQAPLQNMSDVILLETCRTENLLTKLKKYKDSCFYKLCILTLRQRTVSFICTTAVFLIFLCLLA